MSAHIAVAGNTQRKLFRDITLASLVFLAAIAALFVHAMLVVLIGALGFAFLIPLLFIACFVLPHFAFCLLLAATLLQNFCLALVVSQLDEQHNFQLFQSTNFLIPSIIFAYAILYVYRIRRSLPTTMTKILSVGALFAVIVIAYTVYGLGRSSLMSAAVYGRFYLIGFMTFLIGIMFSFRIRRSFIEATLLVAGIVLVAYGLLEFVFPEALYSMLNANTYMRLKYASSATGPSFSTVHDVISSAMRSYLNLSGQFGLDLKIMRIMGPNFHSISYGYALAFIGLIAYMAGNRVLFTLSLVPLLIVGAKGAIILVALSVLLARTYRATGSLRFTQWALVVILITYVVGGMVYGLHSKDYHVIGFLGGVNGFMHNPAGYGIGVGGNLSVAGQSEEKDFAAFQNSGATFALESGIGVLLYQIGVSIVILFWFWTLLVRHFFRSVDSPTLSTIERSRRLVLPVALSVLLASGIFQEETFSPAGWGLWMLAAGLVYRREPHFR